MAIRKLQPNFIEVIDWISAELVFSHTTGDGLSFLRFLLVGPVATGKTTFSLEWAKPLRGT